ENYLRAQLEAIASSTALAASLATREIEAILKHPLIPSDRSWLTAADTLEAFGRVANAIAKRPPDLLIAVNEGLSVAMVIRHQLSLAAPIVMVHGAVDTE